MTKDQNFTIKVYNTYKNSWGLDNIATTKALISLRGFEF